MRTTKQQECRDWLDSSGRVFWGRFAPVVPDIWPPLRALQESTIDLLYAGGGVRNLIVQAEMSGNAKITVVGEVSGSITVASMSGNAKIEAGSCGKPTTKTGTITGSAAITGTGC